MVNVKNSNSLQGLDRAFELLELLAKNTAGMNISEISKVMGITRVTGTNIVKSLSQRNYIEKDPLSGKYVLGYKVYEIAQVYRYHYPFLFVAEEAVRNMADKLNVRINVSVLKSPGVAVVVMSKDVSLMPHWIVGYVMPAYASASGKLLLALSGEEECQSYLDGFEYNALTSKTIISREALEKELETIRKEGIAFEEEELAMQHCCIASPIYDLSGHVIAAISISLQKDRYDQEKQALISELKLLSTTISSNLGYRRLL